MEYSYIFFLTLFFIFLASFLWRTRKPRTSSSLPTNWPVLGSIHGLLLNTHRFPDYVTDLMKESGGTLILRGPWFSGMRIIGTADPSNIHYMLSKNFRDYHKGRAYHEIFDILGDGIFNSEGKLWESHRRITMSLFKHEDFQTLFERILWNKVENGLLAVLQSVSKHGREMDLQDVFGRLTFDSFCMLVLDYDPESLSIDFPHIASEKAFTYAEEAIFYRHILPESFWKLQKRLHLGKEKKLSDAWKDVDQLMYMCLSQKENELRNKNVMDSSQEGQMEEFNFLTTFMKEYKGQSGNSGDPHKFLRDSLFNLLVAGKDSISTGLSWFFYLLAKNPSVEEKIREEIHTKLIKGEARDEWKRFGARESGKLIYLHGAICEALRLYPPVPFEHKAPLQKDILPSGHQVDQHTKIILCFYSMGRMDSIWGDDCLEFKPERWFTEKGEIKHEPSYKFTAFNAGPRTCLGKEMTFFAMKIVATTIIYNYHIELVENHPIVPLDSVVLEMKYGLKVRLIDLKK